MTTALFLLRCVQLGLSMQDLELLTIGMINDMYVESRNDDYKYPVLATQERYEPVLMLKKALFTDLTPQLTPRNNTTLIIYTSGNYSVMMRVREVAMA
jgi:hypothetical protein